MAVPVSIYGSRGSFSEDAALQYFSPTKYTSVVTTPSNSLDGLFRAVADGSCAYAVAPIENSVSGMLQSVLIKVLEFQQLHIVGEIVVAEEHCLCVQPGTRRQDVRTVLSHDHLLQQSQAYLDRLAAENGGYAVQRECTFDSAAACALVDAPHKAAIASRRAWVAAGLEVVGSKIADLECETRYLVLSLTPHSPTNRLGLCCSVSFLLPNQQGAMFRAMSCFAFRNLNLLKVRCGHV